MDDLVVGRINMTAAYESPIEKVYRDIQRQMMKQDEDNIMVAVNQAVGYTVDKEELIKALQYDRDQYKKGYSDALSIIEDIKAEIEDYHLSADEKDDADEDSIKWGLKIAYDIINKHINAE